MPTQAPDGVDAAVVAQHGHLGAAAGVAGDRLDLDHAVVDLGHLLGEQLGHEARVRAAEQDLRALQLAPDVVDVAADAVADVEGLARDRLVPAHDPLASAEVDDGVAVLDALDRAVDDVGDAVLVLFVLPLTLGVPDLLQHGLARHLGLHPAELHRRQDLGVFLVHEGLRVGLERVGQADLGVVVLDQLVGHDRDHAGQRQLAGLRVHVGADVVVVAVARLGAAHHGFLDRLDDDLALDRLLAGDRVGDLEQLGAVGADPRDGHQASPSSVSVSSSSSPAAMRAARCSAPRFSRASLRTSLASASQPKGMSAVLSVSPSRLMATLSPSTPASSPLKRLRPSTRRSVSSRASSPRRSRSPSAGSAGGRRRGWRPRACTRR
jgi:hypothetical protein